jgi:hypothetical protein
MRNLRNLFNYIAILAVAAVHLSGCASDKLAGERLGNEAPQVWLASAPPEGSVSEYTLHLFWGGWDPDGEIAYYEYIMTDNETGVFLPEDTTAVDGVSKWNRVNATDSTFTFSADLVADSSSIDFDGAHKPEEFRRSHTFFIRAVDTEGTRSPKPAYRSFTARTLSPTIFVNIPAATGFNAANVPPITTFRWVARDFVSRIEQVQEPDSVRWIVVATLKFERDWDRTLEYIRENPDAEEWSSWHYYQAAGDSGKFWTTPPLDFGEYYFAVQVMDEAGAVSPVFDLDRNVRRFRVSPRSTGPIFTVRNKYIGAVTTSSPNTPPTILDLPSGVGMEFNFEADASSYGGTVVGYRYGWDILDLNDPGQWDVDFTPFISDVAKTPRRTFFFGTHSFFVEVIDNSGFKSRVEVRVNIVPFSMDKNLLIVDDWLEGPGSGFELTKGGVPSDREHDQFWAEMVNTVADFNPAIDVFELNTGGRTFLPIQAIARYKSIIWNATGSASTISGSHLYDLIRFVDPEAETGGGKVFPNLIALFMEAGGHVLLCGSQIMTMSINTNLFATSGLVYPIIFRYELMGDQDGAYTDQDIGELGVGESSFAYNECCLNVLDQSFLASSLQVRKASLQQRCGVNGIRSNNRRTDGFRTARSLDRRTGGGFPRLDLRPEVAGDPSRFYHESRIGMIVDIYNPNYFPDETACRFVAETRPRRECFQPIYGNGCLDTNSKIYNAPVAFWTSRFAERVPDAGGVAARSAVWGFHPVYFEPAQVKQALEVILHEEWQLERAEPQ